MNTLAKAMAKHPFFEGFEPRYLDQLVDFAVEKTVDAGAYIFREGEVASHFYLILEGQVTLRTFLPRSGHINIQTLGPGEVLGWSWFVPPHTWRFGALVFQPVRVIALEGEALRAQCEAEPDFGYELLKRLTVIIAQRLSAIR